MKLFSRWIWRTRQDSGSCHTVKCCPFIKRSSLTSRMIKVYVACTIGMVRACSDPAHCIVYYPVAQFSYSFNVTLLFPFLPFMVQSLLPEISEESTGNYTSATDYSTDSTLTASSAWCDRAQLLTIVYYCIQANTLVLWWLHTVLGSFCQSE